MVNFKTKFGESEGQIFFRVGFHIISDQLFITSWEKYTSFVFSG